MIKRGNNKKKKGFTLIELIIVLAVMAIIALIAIPNFAAVRENSKVKADKQSCETIKRTMLMLVADETVTVKGNTEIEFTVNATTGVGTVTAPTPGATNDETGNGLTTIEITAIQNALKEVKKPQSKVEATSVLATKYVFTINTDASVTNVVLE